jgi:hypothetical protein
LGDTSLAVLSIELHAILDHTISFRKNRRYVAFSSRFTATKGTALEYDEVTGLIERIRHGGYSQKTKGRDMNPDLPKSSHFARRYVRGRAAQ